MQFSLRIDNIGNRKATMKRDLAIKDIRDRILFPAEIEWGLQYVAIDAAKPTIRPSTLAINDAWCGKRPRESARIHGHEKSLNFAFNKLARLRKKEKLEMYTAKARYASCVRLMNFNIFFMDPFREHP